jgi:oligosaccharide repeat unit polymerase
MYYANLVPILTPIPISFKINAFFIAIIIIFTNYISKIIFIDYYNRKIFENINLKKDRILSDKNEKSIFFILIFIFFIESIYSQGVPIIWIISGSSKSYTDFGLPSVHGIFNGSLLFLASCAFFNIINGFRKKIDYLIIFSSIIIPIITLHRQFFVSLFLQFIFIIIINYRTKIISKIIPRIISATLIIFLLFGSLGNIRSGENNIIELSGSQGSSINGSYLWSYLYITTPLSNLVELSEYRFNHAGGFASIEALIPSAVRPKLVDPSTEIVMDYFQDRSFNSSTFAFLPFIDFGWLGIYVFTVIIFVYGAKVYTAWQLCPSPKNGIKLSIFNQMVVLMVFSNFFLSLAMIFQFILANFFIVDEQADAK